MASLFGARGGGNTADRTPSVRILVVGNSGSGKTSVAHLIANGTPAKGTQPTVGCSTSVTLFDTLDNGQGLGEVIQQRSVFIELWDIGAHERYKSLRSSFYADISGVIIVVEAASRRWQASVRKWAAEVASRGRFVAPQSPDQAAANPGNLPVPCLVISNKADLRGLPGRRGGGLRGLFVWLEALMQQFKFRRKLASLLRPASSSALSDEKIASNVVSASATQGFIDTAAVDSFFADCVAQRLGHASTSGGVPSPNLVRRAATTSAVRDMDATGHGVYGRKPPIPPALYNGRNGPPAPLQSSFAAPQSHGTGPPSVGSWSGFSRTTSFHSVASSMSDYGGGGTGWSAARYGQAEGGHSADDADDLV